MRFSINIGERIISSKLWRWMKSFYRSTRHWQIYIYVLFNTLFRILLNPSFWTFCVLALGIGSLGLWIGIFSGKEFLVAVQESGKETILTFCIALLGNIAIEQYFEEKSEKSTEKKIEESIRKHVAILCWCIALLFSFYSYFIEKYWYTGIVLTAVFWTAYMSYKPAFEKINNDAINDWKPNFSDSNSQEDTESSASKNTEIRGKGL